MARTAPRETPRPNGTTKHRSKKQMAIKYLKKMNAVSHSQWVVLMVDAKGKPTIEASEAFQSRRDTWFTESVLREAIGITVDVANEIRARGPEQIGQQGGKSIEREAVVDEDDDFEEDAEHEDEDGLNGRLGNMPDGSSIPKHMLHFPDQPPPPRMFGSPPRLKKRVLQTVKLDSKKRQRSIVKPEPQNPGSTLGESNEGTAQGGVTYRPLRISDNDAVTTFFETRFRQMQQLTCKVVAKAWIKVIEPKKQSNFPYNRGEEKKPVWWPVGARHKEPDHLMKPERLLLLMTMLRCRRVPVERLEMATTEVAGHFQEGRIELLDEIYTVAKMEERFIDGMLPPESCCYVASSADKCILNPKPQSPKSLPPPPPAENPEPPPESACGQPAQEASKINIELRARQTPRQSPTTASAPPRPSVTFPAVGRAQTTVHAPGSLNFSPSFTQSGEQAYIEHSPPFGQNLYRGSVSYGRPNTATQVPRRANSIPQPAYDWPIQVGGLFSSYSAATQHQSHTPHTPHSLGGSNPPTPITNAAFTPVQLLPPPLPPIHQHQSHSSLAASHHDISMSVAGDRPPQYDSSRIGPHMNPGNVSFSEFLQSPERAYDLGGVSPELADEDIVGISGSRVPDSNTGIPGSKEISHS